MSENTTPTPEQIRIKQLEDELATRQRLAEAAEKEINRVWEAYSKITKPLTLVGIVVVSVLAFFGFRTFTEIREAATTAASKEVEKTRVQVREYLDQQFTKDEIQKLVTDKAKERIDLIADASIKSNISLEIKPMKDELWQTLRESKNQQESQIQEFDRSLKNSLTVESNLQVVIDDAKQTLKRLDVQSEFVTTAILADHDDRRAFEKLENWANTPNFDLRDAARRVARGITMSFYDPHYAWEVIPWEQLHESPPKETWDMNDVRFGWLSIRQSWAPDYVNFVWAHTNLTKEEKIAFCRDVYLKDSQNSLQAADRAARLLAGELGAKYNPSFDYSDIEKRWHEYTETNHLFIVSNGVPTNIVYEIIPPGETSRVILAEVLGRTKLVFFRLRYPPVLASIEGIWWQPTAPARHMVPFTKGEGNVIWTHFNDLDLPQTKFEFKYEKDTSKNVIRKIQVETNKVVLDDLFKIPFQEDSSKDQPPDSDKKRDNH